MTPAIEVRNAIESPCDMTSVLVEQRNYLSSSALKEPFQSSYLGCKLIGYITAVSNWAALISSESRGSVGGMLTLEEFGHRL